jgi:hypothetical protein
MTTPSDADTVLLSVPRSALTIVAPPPERVSQATSLDVFGLPPKRFAQLAKAGAFAAAREGRLWLARTEDVRAYLDSKARVHGRTGRKAAADEREAWAEASGFRKVGT